MIITSIDLAL